MEITTLVNDEIDEKKDQPFVSLTRNQRSLSGRSYESSDFGGESGESHQSLYGRKSSRADIPHSFAWSMSSETYEEIGLEGKLPQEVDDDDRHDARQRLMTEENSGRERVLSTTDDGFDSTVKEESTQRIEGVIFDRPTRVGASFRAASCPVISSLDTYSEAQVAACFRSSCPEENSGRERVLSTTDDGFDLTVKEESTQRIEEVIFDRPARVGASFRAASCPVIAACFRSSCPEMPLLSSDAQAYHIDHPDRVQLSLRRTRAFAEEGMEPNWESNQQKKVRLFHRSDSMLIDSTYGSADSVMGQGSPTAVWVYWGDNRDEQSPFSSVFRQQF